MPHTSNPMVGEISKIYFVYILASKARGTLYIGVTNSILDRVLQHRNNTGSAFTRRYKVHILVWYETFSDVRLAIQREKTLKHYVRDWKISLIERDNPYWQDLYPSVPGAEPRANGSPDLSMDPRDKPEDDNCG